MPNIQATKKLIFLTPNAKKDFNYLWLAFMKALIFKHFDSKGYICIEKNT